MATSTAEPTTAGSTSDQRSTTGAPLWLVGALLLLGCVYPLIGPQIVEACQEFVYPEPHGQMFPPPEYMEAVVKAETLNTGLGFAGSGALFFALLGGLLGASIDIKKSLKTAVLALLIGGLLAAAAGALGYHVEALLRQSDREPMIKSAMILSALFLAFGVVGASVARAIAPQVAISQSIVLGIVSALLAMVAYILTVAVAIPAGWTDGMHPDKASVTYLFYFFLCQAAVVAALLLVRGRGAAPAH